MFIVGNYGTGKSHLMAVISSICEHADLLIKIQHPAVRQGLEEVAGKFVVVRQETSATKMALRDVVFTDLEKQLSNLGIQYHFPPLNETTSNKQLLAEMMRLFEKRYPDKGLLIVLDELLDYLRARDEKEIILDLNFLREIGESCESMPLRFIAGIQEALFDNPRFSFVADSIKRVQSRFDQSKIVKEDIAYVVSHRLLRKSDQQRSWIRKHLEKFTPLYRDMAERLDDFVEMFPVHPSYIEIFEQVSIGERRDLLKALSMEMQGMLDQEVPIEEPRLITFDSYWRMICEDDAFRTIPDVRNVQDKARVLTEKVKYANETKDYRDTALRIIDGLALHRLTVSDIYAPIGITPTELKDRLCLYLPLPEMDADFLLVTTETILKAISSAVNGQFISHNQGNDQYYLDLKKDIDFEALIEQKAITLSKSTLDRYFFDIVKALMEITEGSYVSGFRIWEKEIPWEGHGITRKGYLFLGAANERSTAHPERDFYIHFHALYGNGIKDLRQKADEVYFFPDHIDDSFHQALRLFAGASEMAAISSGTNRDQYDRKVKDYQRVLVRWMNENFIRSFRVLHEDSNQSVTEVIADQRLSLKDFPFRDQVYKLSGALLKQHFQQQFPQYPSFQGVELNNATLYSACDQALRAINGGPVSRTAQIVLEGLQLGHVESNRLVWSVFESPYAAYFLDLIDQLESGKVLNRSSLYQGEPGAERDVRFGLEPEFVSLILAALLKQGAIAVNARGLSIREPGSNGDKLTLEQLLSFTSISKPKPIPEQAVKELFTSYGIPPELLDVPQSRELAVSQFQQKLATEQSQVVRMLDNLRDGPRLGQKMVLSEEEQKGFRNALEKFRDFLNGFSAFSNYSRLANLDLGLGEIRAGFKAREKMEEVGSIFEVLTTIRSLWDYLKDAREQLERSDPWRASFDRAQDHILEVLGNREKRRAADIGQQLRANLENLQLDYMGRYQQLHQKSRLDREQDQKKVQVSADPRWARLRALSKLNLLPTVELNNLQDKLKAIRSCSNFRKEDLKQNFVCPYCGFSPAAEGVRELKGNDLDAIHTDLGQLETKWVNVLLENLNTAQAQNNLKLIDPKERAAVQNFLQARKIPEPITEKFLDGVENALLGLEVVEIDGAEYLLAITKPGMPCTPDELDKRLRQFLQERLAGKDRQKVRIQINW
ncbi:MAG: hypothetical protein GX457_16925 [Thermotogaceae bacterium]|nr:hypothetical protein [Thermotogaceae bacterium]